MENTSTGRTASPSTPTTDGPRTAAPHALAHPAWAHAHTSRCWWDHRQARWVCPGPLVPPGGVDVRDMIVVHTAMLRELRLLPAAVEAVPDGDRRSVRRVVGHLDLVAGMLHHHHEGEDELLWPVLRPRLTPAEVELLEVAEAQHVAIEAGLGEVEVARRAWLHSASVADGRVLSDALGRLSGLLREHTDAEERHLLPLASRRLSEEEWQAVGAAGAASVPKRSLPLVLGMFAYEGDPDVLASMLASAPPPVRALVPRLGRHLYARRARAVHGTPRP